jgi:predicted amino acid racemase
MTAPRLEIDLKKLHHNTQTLVRRLSAVGISVTGMSKATLGSPKIAVTLLSAGATAIGDSRVENIERLRNAGISAKAVLTRSPMLSQVARVSAIADVSLNTELDIIDGLSIASRKASRTHGVILMVELGDLREGIMPADLKDVVRRTLCFPNIALEGIGTNLACLSGVMPNADKMAELSSLADGIEAAFGLHLNVVSGGNSANVAWALGGGRRGRVNNLRLGEALLLGRDTLNRRPLVGLHTDSFTLVAEVIESGNKPTESRERAPQGAFQETPSTEGRGGVSRAILALGLQDVDIRGLAPPAGIEILGASGDHLVVARAASPLRIGEEVAFQLTYEALVGAMTSPFVAEVYRDADADRAIDPVAPLSSAA